MSAEYDRRFREPFRAGDVIAWRTWSGTAVVLLESVRRDGTASIRSADGHSEFFERVPDKARPATAAELEWWAEHARPAFPPGYH